MNPLVELSARCLEPDERAAVLGDILELNETGRKALRGILGLIIRRQIALWKDWHPWLVLLGLVAPVCPMLFIVTSDVTSPLFRDMETYWRFGSLYSSGMTLGEELFRSFILALGLLLWSWTSGFVLGRLSRKTLWLTGTLYFACWTIPLILHLLFVRRFPTVVLLVALQCVASLCLFVFPSIKGFRHARRQALPFGQAALLTLSILCFTVLATWIGGWPAAAVTRWAGGPWDPSNGWPSRLLFYGILAWPVAYLLLTAKPNPFAKLKKHGEFRG
jgi:hypothetical protein